MLTAAFAPAAHADDFTKLTLLTFSGPVDVPGITLPAGTYRFQLADPSSGRRVVKVSDKDGTKTYGMFLSIPNQRMTPTNKPVVMFKETGGRRAASGPGLVLSRRNVRLRIRLPARAGAADRQGDPSVGAGLQRPI